LLDRNAERKSEITFEISRQWFTDDDSQIAALLRDRIERVPLRKLTRNKTAHALFGNG
jgi:hypothetical protein